MEPRATFSWNTPDHVFSIFLSVFFFAGEGVCDDNDYLLIHMFWASLVLERSASTFVPSRDCAVSHHIVFSWLNSTFSSKIMERNIFHHDPTLMIKCLVDEHGSQTIDILAEGDIGSQQALLSWKHVESVLLEPPAHVFFNCFDRIYLGWRRRLSSSPRHFKALVFCLGIR